MISIDLFGPLRVRTERVRLGPRDFPGVKPKQLLENLACAGSRVVSKESLGNRLWGDNLPPKYAASLESYVSLLRQAIEPGVRPRESLIRTETGGYRLDSDRVQLDLDLFDTHLGAAAAAAPAAALLSLDSALALVRGQVLEDEPYAEWAQELRTTYLPRQVQALVSAGQLSLLSGDPSTALARAETAAQLNPLSETACQVQMTAAYALWRQDEALAAFDRCRRLLAAELGVDPMDGTVALHLAILRHEDLASMLPRVPLDSITSSINSITVASGGPAAAAPPVLPELLARQTELGQLRGAVERARSGQFTLVLVTGEMGMGKTSLVEAAAQEAAMPLGSNRCSDLEQELPYLALANALRSLPDGPALTPTLLDTVLSETNSTVPFDGFARLRVMEHLAGWFSEQVPALLLLDDVQYADAESLRTIGYLHRRCPQAQVVVVLTCSRRALSTPALRALNIDLRIDLDVLPVSAVPDEQLYALTGGHPLFLTGWATARSRGLSEPFPPELCERIIMDCWDLGPQAYQLLSVCCAFEQPLTPPLLASLIGTSTRSVADKLEQLTESGILLAVHDGFAFRSPAVQAILSDTLSPIRRAMLKQQLTTYSTAPARRSTDTATLTSDGPSRRAGDKPTPPQTPDLTLVPRSDPSIDSSHTRTLRSGRDHTAADGAQPATGRITPNPTTTHPRTGHQSRMLQPHVWQTAPDRC